MSAIPGVPRTRIFELLYKKGAIAQRAHFSSANLESAIELGRRYCEKNNLHFIFVNPWEMDLQELLDKKEEFAKAS